MRINQVAATGLISVLAALAVGCSNIPAVEKAEVRQSFGIPADTPMKDLGAVKLRAGIPKRVSVGRGKDWTITATLLTNGLVRMNLLYESKGQVIDGVETRSRLERSQLVFRPAMVAGWRLCLPQVGEQFVVAMQPTIIP